MYLADEFNSVIIQSDAIHREISAEVHDACHKGLGILVNNVDRSLFKINNEIRIMKGTWTNCTNNTD